MFVFKSYLHIIGNKQAGLKILADMKNLIGQLKVTTKVYCEVCGMSHSRKLVENVFENTPEAIQKAKNNLTVKASKKYTCNICKSILKDVNND